MNDTINRVIVPGTFDPITFGHIDVIRRARRIFPSVIVAVAESQGKNGVGTTFMLDERVALAREALGDIDGVEVISKVRGWSAVPIIVISARIEDADKILVMDGGQIVAMGTHDELLKTCDIYRETYESQMKGGSDNEQ